MKRPWERDRRPRHRLDDQAGHRLEAANGLTDASPYLVEASVTRHRNGAAGRGSRACRTEIRHAACERHVIALCEFLVALEQLSAMRADLFLLRSAPQRLRSLGASVARQEQGYHTASRQIRGLTGRSLH